MNHPPFGPLLLAALTAWFPWSVHAQVEASRIRDRALTAERTVMPSASMQPLAVSTPVLVIPDDELFRGLDLSAAQREALTARLKTAPFKVNSPKLKPTELQAQRLPSGELFQVIPRTIPLTTMQQHLPAPGPGMGLGSAADPCAASVFAEAEVLALRKVIAAQLLTRGGDVEGFGKAYPETCRRTQVLYLLKAAVVAAR
jgi:hypothetical protein